MEACNDDRLETFETFLVCDMSHAVFISLELMSVLLLCFL